MSQQPNLQGRSKHVLYQQLEDQWAKSWQQEAFISVAARARAVRPRDPEPWQLKRCE